MQRVAEAIKVEFGEQVEIIEKSAKRIFVYIDKKKIKNIIHFLFVDLGARFSTASGIDDPGYFEILYHMAFDKEGMFVTVKTQINKSDPEIDSITSIVPGAEWIEREIHELLGIKFKGHPNLKRLLLADDWPEGVYPLRKEFPQVRRE